MGTPLSPTKRTVLSSAWNRSNGLTSVVSDTDPYGLAGRVYENEELDDSEEEDEVTRSRGGGGKGSSRFPKAGSVGLSEVSH